MSFNAFATRTPHTVLLKVPLDERKYRELPAGVAVTPGMLIESYYSSGEKVRPHATAFSRWMGEIAYENSLVGATSGNTTVGNTIDDAYAIADQVRCVTLWPGDVFFGLLKAGQSVTDQDWLASNGDGKLCLAPSSLLANIVADSTTITSTATIATFSNGTVSIPANSLKVGDVIRIRGRVAYPSTNSTDTAIVTVKLGSTTLFATGAVDVANNDICLFDFSFEVRTIGASGTIVGSGSYNLGVPGTATTRAATLESTTLDTTAAASITVAQTWSVSSASNQAILRELSVSHVAGTSTTPGGTGISLVGQAEETSDLSLSAVDGRIRVRKAA